MKKSLIIFFVILIITSAYAQVQITDPSRQTNRVINLQIPGPPIFNNATANVNSSEFAHIWITNEGNMDNVPDLYPTLDTRFCRFEDCLNISGDTMTGDLILNDDVRLLLGTSGGEGQIFSDGVEFQIRSIANKNIIVKAGDASGGTPGNITISSSDSLTTGGYTIIKAGDGSSDDVSTGGFTWIRGGAGSIQSRGVRITDQFGDVPIAITEGVNTLFVEGQFEGGSSSTFNKGLRVNGQGGSTSLNDFIVETNIVDPAFFIDASIDHLFINIGSNITNNMTFESSAQCSGTFEHVVGDAGSHLTNQDWRTAGSSLSPFGIPLRCNGVIDGIIVAWDADPTTNPETVILKLENVLQNGCSVTVEAGVGNFGVERKRCDIPFNALERITVRGNFTSGTSLTDGVAVIYGRYFP